MAEEQDNQTPEQEFPEKTPIEASVGVEPEAQGPDIDDPEWQKTLDRLGLGKVDATKITYQDILYLAKRWQFLQVVESTGEKTSFDKPELITAQSGWIIHNYGDAMATSPGHLIFGGGDFRILMDDDSGEAGGGVNLGVGTLIKQAFDTAAEMVRLAQEFGWGGMLIVDGHPDMQRAAWVEAVRVGVRLDGFTPDMTDEHIRRRIVSMTVDEMYEAINALRGG